MLSDSEGESIFRVSNMYTLVDRKKVQYLYVSIGERELRGEKSYGWENILNFFSGQIHPYFGEVQRSMVVE